MKRVIIFGLKYDTNIGDYLIGYNLQHILGNVGCRDVRYEDLRGREKSETQKYSLLVMCLLKIAAITTKNSLGPLFEKIAFRLSNPDLKKKFDAILKKYDTVVFAGGGIIECEHYGCHHYIELITDLCEKQGIDIIYNAVGFNGDYNEKIAGYRTLRRCINSEHVRAISVRENIKEMQKYTDKEVRFVCDPACHSMDTYRTILKKNKDDSIIGIGLIRPNIFREFGYDLSDDEVLNLYTDIIKLLLDRNLRIIMFTNGVEKDALFGEKINSKLGVKLRVVTPHNDEEFISTVSSFRAIVSARMHASIVAYSLNIPSINLCWNKKLIHFYENIGYTNRCIIPELFSAEYIVDSLVDVLDDDCTNKKRSPYLQSVYDFLNYNIDYLV